MGLSFIMQNPQGFQALPKVADLEHWLAIAWLSDKEAECVLRVVDNAESQQLNQRYRGKNKSTNVLSFGYDNHEQFTWPPDAEPDNETLYYAGDLVLCLPVIEQEAQAQGKTIRSHWAHMIIHGLLHLQGFDHVEPEDADIMEAQEIALLKQLGFSNPY